jgi:hypothetical protein
MDPTPIHCTTPQDRRRWSGFLFLSGKLHNRSPLITVTSNMFHAKARRRQIDLLSLSFTKRKVHGAIFQWNLCCRLCDSTHAKATDGAEHADQSEAVFVHIPSKSIRSSATQLHNVGTTTATPTADHGSWLISSIWWFQQI